MRARLTSRVEVARSHYEVAQVERPSVGVFAAMVERAMETQFKMLASYLAFRLFLLLPPLILVVIALAGYEPQQATDASESLDLGRSITRMIATAGADAHRSRLPLLLTGLIAFAISGWGMLGALQMSWAMLWRIPVSKFPGKASAFFRMFGSGILFAMVIFISARVRSAGVAGGLAGATASLVSVFVAYLGLGWILPRRSKEWFWLLPGAALGAGGQVLLQAVATWYLPGKLADASATYGALGITLTVLGYLFLLGLLLTLAPTLNAVMWECYQAEPPGLLRRIAAAVPIPTTTWGSGYVPEGDEAQSLLGGPSWSGER